MDTHKVCRTCGLDKPAAEFYTNNTNWLFKDCIKCHNARRKAVRDAYRAANPIPPRSMADQNEPCAFPNCRHTATSRVVGGPEGRFCTTHGNQWRKFGAMKEIRYHGNANYSDTHRRCTLCGEVKVNDEFYDRTDGVGKQGRCKTCALKISRVSALIRQDRLQEALEMAVTVPEPLRTKYVDKVTTAINKAGTEAPSVSPVEGSKS